MQPINSYKQVSVDGPASRVSATNIIHSVAEGVDNYTGPSAFNREVPTGAKVMSIDLQCAFTNLVGISANMVLSVQIAYSNQSFITPNAQGGNNQRNQVFFTKNVFLGQNQNSNFHWRIKIPKRYQRIREGQFIAVVYRCDTVFASVTQAIYKFYR